MTLDVYMAILLTIICIVESVEFVLTIIHQVEDGRVSRALVMQMDELITTVKAPKNFTIQSGNPPNFLLN